MFVMQRETSHQQSINYAAYLSGTVTFILLFSVVMYHGYSVLRTRCLQKLTLKRSNSNNEECSHVTVNTPNAKQSSSEIEGLPHCVRRNSASQDLDDMVSIASIDRTTPLLD